MKTSWSKIVFVASDIVIAAYLALAFTTFDKKGDSKVRCSKVNIEIADGATGGFLDAKVIKERLQNNGCYPIGKPLSQVNARYIEEMLRQSPFVKTAECYKTEGGHVYISVTQRMPVIRIKADNGDDYYVDDNDCIMPRSNYTSDLIIASGNISRKYATNYISPLGKAIMQNDMWKNLIEQIHILPDGGVELVPRIGNHIVYIGKLPSGTNRQQHEKDICEFIGRKMTRLEKFYKYGLSQVGWNKYSYVNIEFDNQIICTRSGSHRTETPKPEDDAAALHAADGPSEGEAETTAATVSNGGATEPETKKEDKPTAAAQRTKETTAKAKGGNSPESDRSNKSSGTSPNKKKTSNKEKNNT